MASFLTASSVLQCPHGGSVTIVAMNGRAKAGSAIACASDTFTITGCSQGTPCTTVQWVVPAMKVKASGNSCLTLASVGICQSANGPEGPVVVVTTQPRAGGQ